MSNLGDDVVMTITVDKVVIENSDCVITVKAKKKGALEKFIIIKD